MARETSLQLKSKSLSFRDYTVICFYFVPSSSFSVWVAFHFSLSCSVSPLFSPACSLWGNPWQIKIKRTYQRQITSGALRKGLLHQSTWVFRRASSLQCLTCELDMHPTEEEVKKWYPHYSKWIKIYSLRTNWNISTHNICSDFHGNHIWMKFIIVPKICHWIFFHDQTYHCLLFAELSGPTRSNHNLLKTTFKYGCNFFVSKYSLKPFLNWDSQ